MKIVSLPHHQFQALLARLRRQQVQPVFAGGRQELRRARRANRRSRRAARRSEKQVELEQETRANRKRRKQAQRTMPSRQRKQRTKERATVTAPSDDWQRAWEPMGGGSRPGRRGAAMQQPSQMPGGRPFPSPRRAGNRQYEDEGFDETYDDEGFDETYDDAYEEENFDETYDDQGFDEAYEDEGFDEDMEAAGVRESWGQKVPLGENLTLRARIGYRAAVIPWKPGMFIVAEVPEDVARKEARRIKLGFDPVVTPLILKTVAKRLLNRPATPAAPEVKQGTIVVPVVSGNLPVPRHYARLGWADPADLAEIGCECQARRRR